MSNVIKQLGGGGTGPSIRDRIAVAKYTVSGEGLGRSVCKATTEQIAAPKKKHLDYLLQCTNEPNVSIPKLADLLIGRTQHHNWVTVYKGLITIHHLMNYGNERFIQYLASNNCTLSLPTFFDKNTTQGYDMSMFVRRYSKYVNDKAVTYRAMAFDFCKVKRGKEDGLLRTMPVERLLKTVPMLQTQIDSLVEFDAQPNDLHNGVINASFMLLFKDLIRLFACYNDGMISLLEKYFELPRKQCREALDTYKRFLVRMDKVSQFLRVAEAIGIDKGEVPDLARAPSTLLEALETHLTNLESGQSTTSAFGTKLPAPSSPSAQPSSPSANTRASTSDDDMRRVLEEEARRIDAFEKTRGKTAASTAAAPTLTPVSTASAEFPSFDLFDAAPNASANAATTQQSQNVSVDQLFSLDMPSTQPSQPVAPAGQNPFLVVAGAQPVLPASNPFLFTSNPVAVSGGWPAPSAPFMSGSKPIDFDVAFGNAPLTTGSPMLLQPSATSPTRASAPVTVAAKPVASPPVAAQSSLLTGDIDSSIASLAGNLSVSGGYGKQNWSAAASSQQKQPIGASVGVGASAATPFGVTSQPATASNTNPFGASWSANSSNILQPQPVASARPNSTAILQNQLPQLYALRPGMPVGVGVAPTASVSLQYSTAGMPNQQAAWGFGQPAPSQQPNDPFGAL